MTRYGIMIGCVLLLGAGVAWLPAAQEKPAGDGPNANGETAPASTGNQASSQEQLEREAEAPHRMQSHPRERGRAAAEPANGMGLDHPQQGRPELGRWSDRHFGRDAREFSKDQVERVMQVVRDLDPDRAARLEQLRKNDPERFAVGLARAGRHLLGLSLLRDREPELYELKLDELRLSQQTNRIAQEILAARETCSEGELERLESMLRDRIREQLELNYQARAREIIMLERHLVTMRDELREDIKHREDQIESRMTDLLYRTPDGDAADAESFAADNGTP